VPAEPFTIVEELVAPGDPGSHYHLVDYQTQELVSTLWSAYLAKAREGLAPSTVAPAMRRVSYSLDSECQPGQRLKRAIRVASRSRRSCTFEAVLSHADDGRVIHSAELVTVFVDPKQGSVEIPADFWAAVEKLEGRSIPVVERSPAVSSS
jgi:acyl-CoA thioesterase FadM